METGGYKKVIFDADSYIEMAKYINIKRVLSKEKKKNIKGFISLWTFAELLSGADRDKHTLQMVDKHCFGKELQQWRFWADPVSMVYYILYKEEPPYMKERIKEVTYLFHKALDGTLTEQEKTHIKSQLETVGDNFIRECKSFVGSVNNLTLAQITTQVIRQFIQAAKNVRQDQTPIKNEEIELIKNGFPGAGVYYEFLMKNKLSQNVSTLSSEKLLHDQRDYHLFYYVGKDDVYIVTQEKKIKTLGLNNVISFEEYLSKVLSLSLYLWVRKILSKIHL